MTTLPDLRDVDRYRDETNDRKLALPVGGHVYEFTVAAVPYRAGLLIKRMLADFAQYAEALARGEAPNPRDRLLSPAEEKYLYEVVVPKDIRDQWERDDITVAEARHVQETVIRWLTFGLDNAVAYWEGRHLAADDDPPVAAPTNPSGTKMGGSSAQRNKPRKAKRRRSRGSTSSPPGSTSKPDSTPTTG